MRQLSSKMIRIIARTFKVDLIRLAYSEAGLLNSFSLEASGEKHFITQELSGLIQSDNPVFFDVGANKGTFSSLLEKHFPKAEIWAFEPNPYTYEVLKKKKAENTYNIGFGEKQATLNLYFNTADKMSVQASSDPQILKEIAKQENLTSVPITVETIDAFCLKHKIDRIHFLKIDTEGFELEVLQGAKSLIKNQKIDIIQFEFNEVNIVKRRFLKDFYDLLEGYSFYRISYRQLIPLEDWQPINELFVFQNIVAVRK